MIITINLNDTDYPMIAKLKEIEQVNIIKQLLKCGYNIYFPSQTKIIKNIEYNEIIQKIETIKNEIFNINNSDKITSLDNNLNKLIGISSNSYKKGSLGEYLLEDLIKNRYGDIIYENKSNTPHSGDGWLHLPDNKIIMLESKNYLTVVNKDEIIKLQNDMINHHIKWSIMVSFNSLIQGMKELDLHTFIHNNETYSIIMIGNLISDVHKLDLGLQIIRKLIVNLDNIKNFPWVVKNIDNSLNELNNILQKNYVLRDSYYNMEKDIQKSLSLYHIILRDYQYDLENKINEIINTIKGTIKTTIELNDNYDCLLKKYSDKKIYSLVVRIIDIIKYKEWKLLDNNNEVFIINNDNNEIGKIKIQLKKIIINIFKFDILINLNLDKDKENKEILDIIKLIT
jgi:hypothetical protein